MVPIKLCFALAPLLSGSTALVQGADSGAPWNGSRFAWYMIDAADFAGALPVSSQATTAMGSYRRRPRRRRWVPRRRRQGPGRAIRVPQDYGMEEIEWLA